MTGKILEDIVEGINKEMKKENRKISLLIDNAGSHLGSKEKSFSNIVVEFLPPNLTSWINLLMQG